MHSKLVQMIVLLYLLLVISMPSTFGIIKRGKTTSGAINAAEWDVSLNQTGINNSVSLTPSGTGAFTLKVVSNSDVDTKYTIVVSNIPSGVDVKLNTEANYRTPVNGTVTFTDAGTILYSAQQKEVTHTLTFRADNNASAVNNRAVHVDVLFQQIV